jgi:hypothetical protein
VIAAAIDAGYDNNGSVDGWRLAALAEVVPSVCDEWDHLVPRVIEVMIDSLSAPTLELFRVSAVDFISKIAEWRSGSLGLVDVGELAAARGICERFPRHSIGLRAIAHLVVVCLREEVTSQEFGRVFVPFCGEVVGGEVWRGANAEGVHGRVREANGPGVRDRRGSGRPDGGMREFWEACDQAVR